MKLGEQSELSLLQGSGTEQDQGDPHVWQDPTNVQKMVATIRDTLAQLDPEGASVYRANANAYIMQVGDLDSWISQQIQTIPPDQRKLVTNHDAFMYYVNRDGAAVATPAARGR